MAPGITTDGWHDNVTMNGSSVRPRFTHEYVQFDSKLQPKKYEIQGTPPNSKILFVNVNILNSTGEDPYRGAVYIEGQRIVSVGKVPNVDRISKESGVRVIDGRGRTLMSGLGDAHTHLTWNDNALELLGTIGVEEHTLITAKSARTYLDSGYTMCYGAASAKDRLDCVIRDAINKGDLPGPRYLANGQEMAKRDNELSAGITAYADGPLEMREVIRHHADIGVDQVKLNMSGESICEARSAEECFFSDEETAACVDEAHRLGRRVCSHARARDSVIQCVRHGVDVIYHASYTDEEGMKMLEKSRHKHVVAPAINWLYTTVHEAEPFGYTFETAERVGYKKELEVAVKTLKEMHRRGIPILPGGDYGFAWCPHGTYARDLEHFVKLFDFSPMESIVAATAGVAKLFMQEDELGKILPGYYADCILVNGDPLKDISILQDHDKLDVIMINGRIHKSAPSDFVTQATQTATISSVKDHYNFIAFEDQMGRCHIGHLDLRNSRVYPLTMASGSPLSNMYQVIELENDVRQGEESFPLESVKLLPPLAGRDVLCIGNNYVDHVKECNPNGVDKDPQKQAPLLNVFTKRNTSVIASNQDIYAHSGFTETLDYEGEVGVIIGKPGFQINESNAMDHVWGFTIINDVTAREKQRGHEQFLMGKSPDTFCPMGPIAVPAAALPSDLRIQTYVNGEKRQDGSTSSLITSIPKIIETISEGITLQAGDVIATGTPAGVGVGFRPPKFLQPGDLVEVSITGLGKLSNRIMEAKESNPTLDLISHPSTSSLPTYNLDRTWGGFGLLQAGEAFINVRELGSSSLAPIVFIHGLGASLEYWMPLIESADLASRHRIIVYDLEGHGLSPAKTSNNTTVDTYVRDLENLFMAMGITRATLVGWSLGGLIAMAFAEKHSHSTSQSLVKKLILLGPGTNPLPSTAAERFAQRASLVRSKGMSSSNIADIVANAATCLKTQSERPQAMSSIRQFLLSTHPEGYAKGCMALALSKDRIVDVEKIDVPTLIVAGKDDQISPLETAEGYVRRLKQGQMKVLEGVGHWHVHEDLGAVVQVVRQFV